MVGFSIDRKIHSIWLEDEFSKKTKKMQERVQARYSDHEVKTWTMKDLTVENFPLTYSIIKKLIDHEGLEKSKIVYWIASLMKLEVIYNQGGMFLSGNYEINRVLDKFYVYPFIGVVENPWDLG